MNDLALNLAIEIISSCVLLVLIISQRGVTAPRQKANRYFLVVMWLMLSMLVIDMASWLIDERPGQLYFVLGHILNYLVYALSPIINLVFVLYVGESIPLEGKIQKASRWVAVVNSAAFLVLLTSSLFSGSIFYIDANNLFHWGELYWLSHLNAIVYYLVILWAVLRSRKKLGRHATIAYLSYPLIPLLADFVNLYFYQVTIGWPAMVIAMLVIFVNIQQQREKTMGEQALMLQNQQMALKLSQIQPHFVFNSLTAIRTFVRTDPEQAEKTLDDFSAHLRTIIDAPDAQELVSFHKELKNVHTYLSIEQQRFKNLFHVEYDIWERFFDIPPLTLQPIVENAVLHGLTIGKGGSRLLIKTAETPTAHIITVMDDGVGFDPSVLPEDGKAHVGLENVRSRLDKLCNGHLAIASQPGKGTTVTITIPKERSRPE